jgi:ribonuclease R
MREHLGEEFGGVVTAATSFGIFVTLDAMYVEGLVHITELGGEYFRFDEARQELRGERTGLRYAIGTRVRVQVSRVDLDGRKIDFRLVREGEELLTRAMKDKSGGRGSDLPDQDRASQRTVGESRERSSVRGDKRAEQRAGGRGGSPSAGKAQKSPIQALKAAVKKSAAGAGRKQSKKPRR